MEQEFATSAAGNRLTTDRRQILFISDFLGTLVNSSNDTDQPYVLNKKYLKSLINLAIAGVRVKVTSTDPTRANRVLNSFQRATTQILFEAGIVNCEESFTREKLGTLRDILVVQGKASVFAKVRADDIVVLCDDEALGVIAQSGIQSKIHVINPKDEQQFKPFVDNASKGIERAFVALKEIIEPAAAPKAAPAPSNP